MRDGHAGTAGDLENDRDRDASESRSMRTADAPLTLPK
jgi:hypothetical protein